MRKYILFVLFLLLAIGTSQAYRISKPQRITAFDHNGLVILNETLEQLWDVTNGRYNLTIVTTNPDGTVSGKGGDMVLYNASGTYYLAINTTGVKIWRSVLLQDLP
jgi:hypothetical protein